MPGRAGPVEVLAGPALQPAVLGHGGTVAGGGIVHHMAVHDHDGMVMSQGPSITQVPANVFLSANATRAKQRHELRVLGWQCYSPEVRRVLRVGIGMVSNETMFFRIVSIKSMAWCHFSGWQ